MVYCRLPLLLKYMYAMPRAPGSLPAGRRTQSMMSHEIRGMSVPVRIRSGALVGPRRILTAPWPKASSSIPSRTVRTSRLLRP